jgi:hypothetical protein
VRHLRARAPWQGAVDVTPCPTASSRA